MAANDELSGGKLKGNHYYLAVVNTPINTEATPYIAECCDIIEALGMSFNEGEAFKAIWRLAASKQGRGKPGNKAVYDADKIAHYGLRIAAQTREQEIPTLNTVHAKWVQMNLLDEAMEHQRE
jgi:hypothetical protein